MSPCSSEGSGRENEPGKAEGPGDAPTDVGPPHPATAGPLQRARGPARWSRALTEANSSSGTSLARISGRRIVIVPAAAPVANAAALSQRLDVVTSTLVNAIICTPAAPTASTPGATFANRTDKQKAPADLADAGEREHTRRQHRAPRLGRSASPPGRPLWPPRLPARTRRRFAVAAGPVNASLSDPCAAADAPAGLGRPGRSITWRAAVTAPLRSPITATAVRQSDRSAMWRIHGANTVLASPPARVTVVIVRRIRAGASWVRVAIAGSYSVAAMARPISIHAAHRGGCE
jgi:hypothetical protein